MQGGVETWASKRIQAIFRGMRTRRLLRQVAGSSSPREIHQRMGMPILTLWNLIVESFHKFDTDRRAI